jgi:hypothetical protein
MKRISPRGLYYFLAHKTDVSLMKPLFVVGASPAGNLINLFLAYQTAHAATS